jgi:hypothetical protein
MYHLISESIWLLPYLAALLTACIPPAFYSAVNVYAVDNGNDVSFSVKVANDPASVTCFGGGVTMSWVSGDTWQGTADYTNDLTTRPGQNTVSCTASNSYGIGNLHCGQDHPDREPAAEHYHAVRHLHLRQFRIHQH